MNLVSRISLCLVTGETEELQGRLKASRTRVADLERSFTGASSSGQKLEKVGHVKVKRYKAVSHDIDTIETSLTG